MNFDDFSYTKYNEMVLIQNDQTPAKKSINYDQTSVQDFDKDF